MSDIEDLQGRITAAMQRISAGIEGLETAPAAPDPGLQEALDEERLANEQLQERLKALADSHTTELAALRQEIDAQADAMAALDTDVQRLRLANDQLRDSNAALREANEEGVGAPDLINKAMLAELEAMRAARATEAAEAGAILSKLQPILAAASSTLAADTIDAEIDGAEIDGEQA